MPAKIWESKEESGEKSTAEEWRSVDDGVSWEESKVGKISDEDLESNLGEEEKDVKAHADDQTNSSFLHAVINMVGMLIGKNLGIIESSRVEPNIVKPKLDPNQD